MRKKARVKKKERRREEREKRVQNRPRGALEAGWRSLLSQLHTDTLSHTQTARGLPRPRDHETCVICGVFLVVGL